MTLRKVLLDVLQRFSNVNVASEGAREVIVDALLTTFSVRKLVMLPNSLANGFVVYVGRQGVGAIYQYDAVSWCGTLFGRVMRDSGSLQVLLCSTPEQALEAMQGEFERVVWEEFHEGGVP